MHPVSTQASIGSLTRSASQPDSGGPTVSVPSVSAEPSDKKNQNTRKTAIGDAVKISSEAREIAQLASRDREVRTHEAAHVAVGGQYAGSPALTYTRGPDGRSYATGGEVSMDVSKVSGDPAATLQKAQIVRAAALAPARPSAQDLRVASRASVMAAHARAELARHPQSEVSGLFDNGGRSKKPQV